MSILESTVRSLHDLTHRIPGIPPHGTAPNARPQGAIDVREVLPTAGFAHREPAHHDPARRWLLPGWQARIERTVRPR